MDCALTIHHNGADKLNLSINFSEGKSKHRRLYGGGKHQPLAKACGLDKHPKWSVFDGTAGLGKDSFVLASLGAHITFCEQHPALYAMLIDAIHRASKSNDKETNSIIQRMTCLYGNTINHLKELSANSDSLIDVIYLDPMYPERKKSAKIKKEMQILQHLVEHTGDESLLFDTALKTANNRVVVKRPKSAKSLNDKKPSYTVSSINTRYDVYVL